MSGRLPLTGTSAGLPSAGDMEAPGHHGPALPTMGLPHANTWAQGGSPRAGLCDLIMPRGLP